MRTWKHTYALEHTQAHMYTLAHTHIYTCTYTHIPYTDLHTHKQHNTCTHKWTHIHNIYIGMQTRILLSVANLEPLKILFLLNLLILNQFLRIYKDTTSVEINKIAYLCWETQYIIHMAVDLNFYLELFGLFIHIIPANATSSISPYLKVSPFIAVENNYVQISNIMSTSQFPYSMHDTAWPL